MHLTLYSGCVPRRSPTAYGHLTVRIVRLGVYRMCRVSWWDRLWALRGPASKVAGLSRWANIVTELAGHQPHPLSCGCFLITGCPRRREYGPSQEDAVPQWDIMACQVHGVRQHSIGYPDPLFVTSADPSHGGGSDEYTGDGQQVRGQGARRPSMRSAARTRRASKLCGLKASRWVGSISSRAGAGRSASSRS